MPTAMIIGTPSKANSGDSVKYQSSAGCKARSEGLTSVVDRMTPFGVCGDMVPTCTSGVD
jgi:hypothetical protein